MRVDAKRAAAAILCDAADGARTFEVSLMRTGASEAGPIIERNMQHIQMCVKRKH